MDVHSEVLVIKRIYDTIDYIVTTFNDLLLNCCSMCISHLKSLNKKITMTYYIMLDIQVLALDRHKNVAVLSQLMGSQPFLFNANT
jgi:hypothetical protein